MQALTQPDEIPEVSEFNTIPLFDSELVNENGHSELLSDEALAFLDSQEVQVIYANS